MNNIGDLISKKQLASQSAQHQLKQIRSLIVKQTNIEPNSVGIKYDQLNVKVSNSMMANEIRLHQTELLGLVQEILPDIKKIRLMIVASSN